MTIKYSHADLLFSSTSSSKLSTSGVGGRTPFTSFRLRGRNESSESLSTTARFRFPFTSRPLPFQVTGTPTNSSSSSSVALEAEPELFSTLSALNLRVFRWVARGLFGESSTSEESDISMTLGSNRIPPTLLLVLPLRVSDGMSSSELRLAPRFLRGGVALDFRDVLGEGGSKNPKRSRCFGGLGVFIAQWMEERDTV